MRSVQREPLSKRLNGGTAEVVAIDPDEGILVVRYKNGERQALDMANVAARHIRPGRVRTIHSAQGATCERAMAHLEPFRSNVDANIALCRRIPRQGVRDHLHR